MIFLVDPAILGIGRLGYFYLGAGSILGKLWDNVLKIFERRGTCNVVLWTLTLGDRDSDTGHRAKSYSNSTIKMIIVTKGARQLLLSTGTHVRLDAVGVTDSSAVVVGDEIQTGTIYYEVDAVKLRKITPGVVEFYECDLTELPLHD